VGGLPIGVVDHSRALANLADGGSRVGVAWEGHGGGYMTERYREVLSNARVDARETSVNRRRSGLERRLDDRLNYVEGRTQRTLDVVPLRQELR
jgi:hypothetical protein